MEDYVFIDTFESQFNCAYGTRRAETSYDENNSGDRLTIDAGYVDPQTQIQQMILAGETLNSMREYDDEEALENEDFAAAVAQIRHPNTDITDIETYTDYINNKLSQAKSEAERKAIRGSLDFNHTYKNYEEGTNADDTPPAGTNPPPQQTN